MYILQWKSTITHEIFAPEGTTVGLSCQKRLCYLKNREKKIKMNRVREMWDTTKCINIHIIGVLQREESTKRTEDTQRNNC